VSEARVAHKKWEGHDFSRATKESVQEASAAEGCCFEAKRQALKRQPDFAIWHD
jgi:hypothetical protein